MVTAASITLRQLDILAREPDASLEQRVHASMAMWLSIRDPLGLAYRESCASILNHRQQIRKAA
jgi:hypothetical protein